MSRVFPYEKILEQRGKPLPKHTVGIYYGDVSAFCLTRTIDGVMEILLSNKRFTHTKDEKALFEKEVRNLADYFNANILEEND